jgi:hypothetical protein
VGQDRQFRPDQARLGIGQATGRIHREGAGQLAQLYHFHPRTKRVPQQPQGTDVLALSHRALPRIEGADGILRAAWANTAPWAGPTRTPQCLSSTAGQPGIAPALAASPPRAGSPRSIRPGRTEATPGNGRQGLPTLASAAWNARAGSPAPSPGFCRPDAQHRRWFRVAVDTKRSFRVVMAPRGAGSGGLPHPEGIALTPHPVPAAHQ